MTRRIQFIKAQVVLVAVFFGSPCATGDCATGDDVSSVRESRSKLVDGVYPVVTDDSSLSHQQLAAETVELTVLALDANESDLPKLRIINKPLLRFDRSIHFGFKFENNECTQVEFENTKKLKQFSRKHAPTRLAVVVGNQVVTHHKLRGPLESEKVRITCCTEGGGDHLHKHLIRIEQSSETRTRSDSPAR